MLTQKDLGEDLGATSNLADVSAAEVKVEIHMDHMNEERSRPMPPPMDEDIMEVKDIAIKQVRLSTQMVSRAYSEKIHRQQIEMMTDDEEGVLSEDEPA